MIGPEELKRRFTYHAPNAARAEDHAHLRALLKDTADAIDNIVPDGREKSTAITKLEEAMFWANAALARPEQTELHRRPWTADEPQTKS